MRRTLRSPRVPLEETGLVCEYDCLHAVAEVELLEDVRDVCLDRGVADVELVCDLCVGEATGDQAKDFLFAGRELFDFFWRRRSWAARELLDHAFCDRG